METEDKLILITGASGFLGRPVVNELHKKGYSNLFTPRSRTYDLTNPAHIKRLFETEVPEKVIHLAANAGGIGYNLAHPAELLDDNLLMGTHLLRESMLNGVEKFVGIGTICSYPRDTPVPFREENLWKGYPEETNAPYGLAKKMLLVQSQAYRDQFGFNAIHLLPVNLYGPRDRGFQEEERAHVIPDMIRKFQKARDGLDAKVTLFGDGSPTREFLYVEDAAEGIVSAMENYNGRAPVNLGSGKEISIRDLAYKIKNLVGYYGKIEWDTSKPNGQPRRCLDTTLAEREFGFKAKTGFDEGLDKTLRWYRTQLT
ncbi:MAG: GDP-L-fucose synthase [Nanoarchaeota archaeon]|nr:GDP-L-fucose synthase [Nanoarchaeota archaeon]